MKTYQTKQDAISALNALVDAGYLNQHSNGYSPCAGTYELAHGEYSAPDYKPVRYKDGWMIKRINYYYAGTINVPINGPVDIWSDDYYGLQVEYI